MTAMSWRRLYLYAGEDRHPHVRPMVSKTCDDCLGVNSTGMTMTPEISTLKRTMYLT